MKEIRLTNGMLTQVDDDVYVWASQYTWGYKKGSHTYYAKRGERRNGKYRNFQLHREIMNAPDGVGVDHKDGNGLNNQRYNLRFCNDSQNNANARPRLGVSSYKGVRGHTSGKWQARVTVNRKVIHLGSFLTELEAAKAYDEAALRLHGEFANLNFKEE